MACKSRAINRDAYSVRIVFTNNLGIEVSAIKVNNSEGLHITRPWISKYIIIGIS